MTDIIRAIFSALSEISGALIAIGVIYVWVKKPINIFNKYNQASKLSQENKERLDKIEPILEKLVETMDNHDVETMRNAIINFANDLKNGESKTEYQFSHIRDLCTRYTLNHNGYVKSQIEIIDTKYNELHGIK